MIERNALFFTEKSVFNLEQTVTLFSEITLDAVIGFVVHCPDFFEKTIVETRIIVSLVGKSQKDDGVI